MPNRRRGEARITLSGRPHVLRLTLGALAELEDAFGVESLPALAARFGEGRLSSRDLVAILGGGAPRRRPRPHRRRGGAFAPRRRDRGGGRAVADALRLAFGEGGPNPPPPQARPGSRGTTSSAS
jgi:hypothetical protein